MPVVQDIPALEQDAFAFHTARGEMTETQWNGVPVTRFVPRDRTGYHFATAHPKRMIVLHFTMGYIGGDLSQLTRQDFKVSVPFVIARNGRIVLLHDPDLWSYHLGTGAVGGNEIGSAESVAIELSGLGPLEKSGNWMFNTYGDRYCRFGETEHYSEVAGGYRGYQYYTRFTAAQYQSLASLLPRITQKYAIPTTFLPLSQRFDVFKSVAQARSYRGICSHVNFRGVGQKTDIGPAFDWSTIGG